ncbi:hypothetical protein RN001_006056 [Aquatica leii]|uniref:OSK domain-containing protein n=1 Tax=Aquatica leii TaxID=1421715 RepID=A0AAN7SIE1_9COLE|nr:hypothetical protein RN001_006056 [Aquatica leii]
MKNGMTRMLTQQKKSNVMVKLITIPPIISETKVHKNRILYFNRFLRKLKYHNIILIDLHKSLRADPKNYLERHEYQFFNRREGQDVAVVIE